jgi:hypothetical protein
MQDPNDEITIKKVVAFLVAILMLVAIAVVYLFPWFVPIIWEMPENTTIPYYGLLVAIEMAPATWSIKTNASAMATARRADKGD